MDHECARFPLLLILVIAANLVRERIYLVLRYESVGLGKALFYEHNVAHAVLFG
jgi:hypothetical protein